jgi:DNA-binding MarR family transcriptional regulator
MKRSGPPASADLRHLPVLESLQGKGNVSQRHLAERIGVAASLVNRLIQELVVLGHLEVVDPEVRPFAYRLTEGGRSYLRTLSLEYYRRVLDDFGQMRRKIEARLREVREQDRTRLVLYGAGDLMEVVLPLARELGHEVLAVVDDDPKRQGTKRGGEHVRAPDCIAAMRPDAVLITSLRRSDAIAQGLEVKLSRSTLVLEV